MLQGFIPHGGAKLPESVPDRTQVLDCTEFWPNPASCPDWPALGENGRYDGPRGRPGAEARLQSIGTYLNRGQKLHKPSEDERSVLFAGTFQRGGSQYHRYGINNLRPLGLAVEGAAELMVEACHIRGYLRKLDAAAVDAVENAEWAKREAGKRAIRDYERDAPAELAEIETLAPAVARHLARLEDERAFNRSKMLTDHVRTLHSAAVAGAQRAGVDAPTAPVFAGEATA